MNPHHPSRRAALALVAGAAALGLSACANSDQSAQARKKTRKLSIALWAGAPETDGAIDTAGGRNRNRRIRGPMPWTDNADGRRLEVYERVKTSKSGDKRQLLTVTHGGQGLGRVLDERPGVPTRRFEDDIIFPLGTWMRGESRSFRAVEHTLAGPAERFITIKIRRLDYVHKGRANSLKYDWTARDAAGRTLYAERYVYSPGVGLARFKKLT